MIYSSCARDSLYRIPANKAAELALEYGILRYAKDLIEHQHESAPSSAPSTTTNKSATKGQQMETLHIPDSETDVRSLSAFFLSTLSFVLPRLVLVISLLSLHISLTLSHN